MKEIRGIPASPGIAIGKVFLYSDDEISIPEYDIHETEIHLEMQRYRSAVGSAVRELEVLKGASGEVDDPDDFLGTHILMLQDPDIETKVDVKITRVRKNVEWVLVEVINELVGKLNAIEDVYLRERALDIRDVSRRVLNHLLAHEKRSLSGLKEDIILVTTSLLPSDAVAMSKRHVRGIVMDQGGKTTHTAILARSFEIPAVLGTGFITKEVKNGDLIIVDGLEGVAWVNPEPDFLAVYKLRMQEHQRRETKLMVLNTLAAETRDGKLLKLNANIEVPEEVESVLNHGADGIGLYRSEFLFLKDGVNAEEDTQFQAYKTVLEGMGDRPVVIRTLDLGGDKLVSGINVLREANPLLGWRAIRFCLAHPLLFKTQLRALLRASVFGNLRIMFPMISGVLELEECLRVLDEVRAELRQEKIPFKEDLPVGTMIEVPSAAMVSDILAKMVDFFSIGTNDLIQYTLAVDRGNEKIAKLYEPFHPGVIRLIKLIIENAHAEGIPVGMCGEMAGDPAAALILLGLGLDEFSMSSIGIPKVKQILRGASFSEAEEVVGRVSEMRSSLEIENFVRSYMKGRFEEFESGK